MQGLGVYVLGFGARGLGFRVQDPVFPRQR